MQNCGDYQHLWFTGADSQNNSNDNESSNSNMDNGSNNIFDEYLLGLLLGLACYNGVLVNLPIVPVIYKLFNGARVSY